MPNSTASGFSPESHSNDELKFRYQGSSMRSTFRPGEVLHVKPQNSPLQVGDVVIFRHNSEYIVHRVNRLHAGHVFTRGDDNPNEDAPLNLNQLVGVVDLVEHSRGLSLVHGGWLGDRIVNLRRAWNRSLKWARPWLGAPYRWLKASRIIPRFWKPQLTTLHLHTKDHSTIKYLSRGKVVATWNSDDHRFEVKRPFDLILSPPAQNDMQE